MEKINPKHLFIVGDVHDDHSPLIEFIRNSPEGSLYICVGDLQVGWPNTLRNYTYWADLDYALRNKAAKLLTIRGNHDNPAFFMKECDITPHIRTIPDYSRKIIDDYEFLFVGGATSIDRELITDKGKYFENEIVEYNPDLCQQCDVLITHAAPLSHFPYDSDEVLEKTIKRYSPQEKFNDLIFDGIKKERKILERVFVESQPLWHYYGHYHTSHTENIDKCMCVLLGRNEIRRPFQLVYNSHLQVN